MLVPLGCDGLIGGCHASLVDFPLSRRVVPLLKGIGTSCTLSSLAFSSCDFEYDNAESDASNPDRRPPRIQAAEAAAAVLGEALRQSTSVKELTLRNLMPREMTECSALLVGLAALAGRQLTALTIGDCSIYDEGVSSPVLGAALVDLPGGRLV